MQQHRQCRRVGEYKRALEPLQPAGLHVMDELGPAVEAVLAGEFVLSLAQADRAFAFARLGLLAQVLK
ncbi:MAG: hypothetical protein ACRDS1_07775 [Pseudonocardiaceae bacterium]